MAKKFLPTNASYLLYEFVKLKKKSVVVEIGTGAGYVISGIKRKFPECHCFGLDLCFDALLEIEEFDQMFVCADAKQKSIPFRNNSFDSVICNPPFFDKKSYRPSPDPQRAMARMEISLAFSELLKTVRYLLKEKGSFFFIHNSERTAEIIIELYKNNMWVKELQFVATGHNRPMKLVLVHARLNSTGRTIVLPSIELNDE